ncbi:MAG TPA: CDGSH iron-sulfur domain-containing protein [Planctomycetota bacterium]|nr:CDGSH iron-sulfur domain-containing protein [Planctomycetota bacterium]
MADTSIQVTINGPLRVTGAFDICDGTGAKFDLAGRSTISLCRCGQSQNKPFCDGAHNLAAFKSDEKARVLPPPKPRV